VGEDPLLLPGVGNFAAVRHSLDQRGLSEAIVGEQRRGRPLLGICVGLQLLLDGSEEAPGVSGLGLLPGSCRRFSSGKVPQVGWNATCRAYGNAVPEGHAYFVNSYYAEPEDTGDVLLYSDYGGSFPAALRRGSITAFQFHPERSAGYGERLLRWWWDAL